MESNSDNCFRKAMEFYDKGQLNEALDILHKCLQENLQDDDLCYSILSELGHIYKIIKNYDQAIGFYNRAVELNPENLKVWTSLAEIHELKRDYKLAIDVYKRMRDFKWFQHPNESERDWKSIATIGLKIEKAYNNLLTKGKFEKNSESLIKKNNVFLSYSTGDSEFYRIPEIAEELKSLAQIDTAKYWEKDSGRDIIDYMEENLGLCNLFILFCSERALNSKSVKMEWKNAIQLMMDEKLRIIPVYTNLSHIPNLMRTLLGVRFEEDNFEGFIEKLNKEVLREGI